MFGPWYYVLKYAKIKRMKNKKKSLLSRFGLVGVSGVIVLGAILKKQKDEKRKEQVKEQIRDYFNQLGEISVLYLNDFESDSQKTTGVLFLRMVARSNLFTKMVRLATRRRKMISQNPMKKWQPI